MRPKRASSSSATASSNKRRCTQPESGSSSGPTSVSASDASADAAANAIALLTQLLRSGDLSLEHQSQVTTLSQIISHAGAANGNNSSNEISNDVKDLIHPLLSPFLKVHQIEAIQFLFNRVIMEDKKISERGYGAILAHCMGLGKSFTIIAFLQAILSNNILNKRISKVLLVCPKNVLEHWKKEMTHWIDSPGRRLADNITISCITCTANDARLHDVKKWFETKDKKQILIIGYEMYGILVQSGGDMKEYLQNPDLVIFDEAHRLKNDVTQAYKFAKNIQTSRIIFLTGTPFQNNLMEFYNTMQLIAPHLFASKDVFKLKFSDPIQRGRSKDARPDEVKLMQVLCKLLYKRTLGIIHRKGVQTLIDELNILKVEVTLMVRPRELQKILIEKYLHRIVHESGSLQRKNPLRDHSFISQILTHPALFFEFAKNDIIESMDISFEEFLQGENNLDLELSNKLMLSIEIIKNAEKVGDKVLLFSQSLKTLNFIEKILKNLSFEWKKQNENGWGWCKGEDYLRIDGDVDSSSRYAYQGALNNSEDPRCRLLLISTKAGSLGTNMIGANRVVIFDACWNPTHDIQSLYRVYRLGQTKPVYIYRLVTSGTMEEIVYNRQIAKEATGHRVIDEKDINRHFTDEELEHLYKFKYIPIDEPPVIKGTFNDPLTHHIVEKFEKAIVAVVSHNSFFDEFNEDEITEQEVTKCEEEYEKEMEKKQPCNDASDTDINDGL